jgi:protein associated with RNAse G/E
MKEEVEKLEKVGSIKIFTINNADHCPLTEYVSVWAYNQEEYYNHILQFFRKGAVYFIVLRTRVYTTDEPIYGIIAMNRLGEVMEVEGL